MEVGVGLEVLSEVVVFVFEFVMDYFRRGAYFLGLYLFQFAVQVFFLVDFERKDFYFKSLEGWFYRFWETFLRIFFVQLFTFFLLLQKMEPFLYSQTCSYYFLFLEVGNSSLASMYFKQASGVRNLDFLFMLLRFFGSFEVAVKQLTVCFHLF